MFNVTGQVVFMGYNVRMKKPLNSRDALFVGDNLALDFINTLYGEEGARYEGLVDDASVMAWLKRAGVLPDDVQDAPKDLLEGAIALRESARLLVQAAKAGREADAAVVNRVIEEGRPTEELKWDSAARLFKVVEQRQHNVAAALLEPVARSLINLLTAVNLDLVRQCEAHDCTLLFHDLTKSHRRRWCSMALCGNRTKVAAYRMRSKS